MEIQHALDEALRTLAETRADRDFVVAANSSLLSSNDSLRHNLGLALTNQITTDQVCFTVADYESLDLSAPAELLEPPKQLQLPAPRAASSEEPEEPEVLRGSDEALALLERITNHTQQDYAAARTASRKRDASSLDDSQRSSRNTTAGDSTRASAMETPARPINSPSSILSRTFSAIKSKLGFAAPLPPASTTTQPASATAPAAQAAPAPSPSPFITSATGVYTDILSPAPLTATRKRRGRRTHLTPMIRVLTKGVPESEMDAAHKWATELLPVIKHEPGFDAMYKRMQAPVQYQDLATIPACEPWNTGYGDPLGDLDDEDIVPVWAVYLDIRAEEELPQQKKFKSTHEDAMDSEDTASLNDMFGPTAPTTPFTSNDGSASIMDKNPRGSREPSPMFASPIPPRPTDNVFKASHSLTEDSAPQSAKQARLNNPEQGSYGLDYDSDDDEEDSTISETTEGDALLWTQAPPPAPVPAHAPLPGASQPVDEIERQRQKLMKHTPAKPSRLREAFVPSPSLLSDAGNDSILLASPIPSADLFADMPDAEPLDVDDELLAAMAEYKKTAEYRAMVADFQSWPDVIITYDSDEESPTPSPVDAVSHGELEL